jgi:hypothetical protein
VCIVCEGQTEVDFVKFCLTPYLAGHGVNAYPTILRAPSEQHRGGRVSVERLVRFILHEYHSADRLTTLVDFYGFQNANGRTRQQLEQDILDGVLKNTTRDVRERVRPYVQMHEFEGLLFSNVEQFQYVLDGWSATVRQALKDIRSQFQTPEDINNGHQTAPSKRILAAFPVGTYSKVEHGPVIAKEIGLAAIRQQCPQFNDWMTMLEAWGAG